MPSLIYNSAARDEAVGSIDYDTDTFKMMLTTSAYVADKDAHSKRSSVTNEVTGTGYTAGGTTVAVTVAAVDTANDRVVITFGSVNWPTSTITARHGVIYKSRGSASSADELICNVDFASDIVSTSGTFKVAASTIMKQN